MLRPGDPPMPNPLTLTRMWRILKEVDLDAIRREAMTPLHVHVIGETDADADKVAILLAAGRADPARFLTAMDAALADDAAAARAHAVVDGPELVIVVARGGGLSEPLERVRRTWLERRVALLTLDLESGEQPGRARSSPNGARVALGSLDDAAMRHVAAAVFPLVRPERRAALARQFPGLRPGFFNEVIGETAKANAGYAFSTGLAEIVPLLNVPLNISDLVVLTKNQLMMSYRIALAAGKDGRPREVIGEILGVIGGGLLFRQAARRLIGLVPVIGIVPKVAVAYGGTWAIGRAVALWATEGRKVSRERLKRLSDEGLARGREIAKTMKRSGD